MLIDVQKALVRTVGANPAYIILARILSVADWDQYRHTFATSSTHIYTKAEEALTWQAYEFLRTGGFPSVGEAIHLLQDGNITGLLS